MHNGRVLDGDAVQWVVAAVRESGVSDMAKQEARACATSAQQALAGLRDSPYVSAIGALTTQIVEREL